MATITAVRGKPTIPGEIRWYPMAATQTFKKGEFVYLDANGRLTVCSSAFTNGCIGMAMADATDAAFSASGATTTLGYACPVTIAKRGQQFTLHVTNAGSTTTTSIAQVGKAYRSYAASNIWYVDVGSSATRTFIVDEIAQEDTVGDTTGRLIVEVADAFSQVSSGTS